MADMADELRKRLEQKPDQWTLAWWRSRLDDLEKCYRGATAAINRSLADYEESAKSIKELRQRVQALEQAREADRALLGEMAARLDRMAEFCRDLKKEKATK